MAQLAIRGHSTRGKEVIEILEMLGGVNRYAILDARQNILYAIRNFDNFIIGAYPTDTFVIFTLEEFLEKFPYKVGDKVSSKYLKNYKIKKMEWEDTNNRVIYKLQGMGWYNASELQPYEEETMEENLTIQDIRDNNAEWLLNKLEGMSVKKVLQTISDLYDKLHKPQYPKTYIECAKILDCFSAAHIDGYKGELLDKLQELLICRDAYWKIAGEQMGLGKPWKPDFMYCDLYCIGYDGNVITWKMQGGHSLLAFPAAEMRTAFYENFKGLIEACKELL